MNNNRSILIVAIICLTVIFVSTTRAPAQSTRDDAGPSTERRYQLEVVATSTDSSSAAYLALIDGDTGEVWTRNVLHSKRWSKLGRPEPVN